MGSRGSVSRPQDREHWRDEGASEAAGVAFERYGGLVYRFLLRRSGNRQDAEDLTQRVFLDAVEVFRNGEVEPRSMLAWLYTVARRRFIDDERRRGLAQKATELSPVFVVRDEEYGSQASAAIRRSIQRLPGDQQIVVVKKVVQGLSFAEISDELGISVEACRMRLSRAVASLRQDLEREGFDPGG
jgi:RNA polymerase sigma-70 factor, ECF subfamily